MTENKLYPKEVDDGLWTPEEVLLLMKIVVVAGVILESLTILFFVLR